MDGYNNIMHFPPQLLSYSKKTLLWRKSNVDAADSQLYQKYNAIRSTLRSMKINYDLVRGKIHMSDIELLINPDRLKANFIPDLILHYDIIGPKITVLQGEESRRIFDYKVVVTNPNAVDEIEEIKKNAIKEALLREVEDTSLSEEDFNSRMLKLLNYYNYEYQDFREQRGNYLLNHYVKEYNMPGMFNEGFMDAMIAGEEIYQCDIVGGEPVIKRLNPMKVRIFKSGYSNKIEDADIIVLHDYWSPGTIIDTFGEVFTTKDFRALEELLSNFASGTDSMGNIDERNGFINSHMISEEIPTYDSTLFFDPYGEYLDTIGGDLAPQDLNGNIRVLQVYWKSRRKIKKVKFYDPQTGEEQFTFMPESYIPNKSKGEEEHSFWINQAWEGTKIGKDIYVNIRPRPVQYNRLNSPSECHFGIVGSIYNINDDKPFTLVDRMKPFAYLYDVIHDRLNKMMSRNWGKMTRLNLALKPKSWNMDKWLYYAKTMGLFVEDGFNEGNVGAATGKLAGAMNMNSQGVIDADFGNNIQQYINLLEYIKAELSDTAGISKQREGQISNRETVGGVERATLQSSHITEWLFLKHDDVKRRALTAFLETAKIALRGRNTKFKHILPDYSETIIDIDGDEFAECDYGLVVDNSNGLQELQLKLETLAQAALLNQILDFSTLMRLFGTASMAEKQRYVEASEQRMLLQRQQAQQLQMLLQLQEVLAKLLSEREERQYNDAINQRDNETKITVAEINSQAELAVLKLKNDLTLMDEIEEDKTVLMNKEKLMQEMLKLDKQLAYQREELHMKDKQFKENLEFQKLKQKEDNAVKRMAAAKSKQSKS